MILIKKFKEESVIKKMIFSLVIISCLFLCSCVNMGSDSFINNAMKFDYDDLTRDAEFVEIVYNNGSENILLKRLDNQNSLDFLKDFSEIEYSCDSIIALFFVSPSTLSKGLQFRIKKSGASNEYRYYSVACGPDVCDADEYYDLIEKYCLDENIDYYRSIEPYRK